jgi:hypothetical protein
MQDLTSPVDCIESKNLIFNTPYRRLLDKMGWNSFESIWGFQNGECVKKIKTRSVIRVECTHQDIKRIFYLKRHNLEFAVISKLFSSFFSKWGLSQGRLEFENICDFRNSKFPTVVPVAAGEKFHRLFWVKSFLITEDFSPYISLEALLEQQPHFFTGSEGLQRRRILLSEISRLARDMHQQGFNHLDFNATHILVHYENGLRPPKLALFDFQRVDKRKFLRFRWKIKSLARLNYSLPTEIFTEKDREHLFLSYLMKDKLKSFDRLQWIWFKRKTARVKHHTDKILARRKLPIK